jgi:hypothetical protein
MLKKQRGEKINAYTLKLFPNMVTAGTEQVAARNKFLQACVKKGSGGELL